MEAPLCHYCTSTPMLQKIRFPQYLPETPQKFRPADLVIFQCDTCKRVEARSEPSK